MSRLFITQREIQFINDVTKEFIKDVVGQTIIYYPISTLKTKVHPVYDEAVQKIFENPIKVDVLAGQPNWETKFNMFGNEQTNKVEIYVHARDILDKGYEVKEGDFFVYNDQVFEILSAVNINNIFGQVEHEVGYKLEAKLARKGQLDLQVFKEMLQDLGLKYVDNPVTKVWQQQRGLGENIDGPTGDHREMRQRLDQDMAEPALGEGPRVVNIDNEDDPTHKPQEASSFDNESPNYGDVPDIYNE